MAVTSGTVNTGTYSKSHFYVDWQQSSQSIASNSTTINWQAGIYTGTSSSHDFWYSNAVRINNVVINGTTVSSGGTWSNITTGGKHQLLSGTTTIPHNQDGSKTFSISISAWLHGNHTLTGSDSFQLTSIPRYTSITTFNVAKRNETSVTVTWGASDACDKIWYSTNNGSSWNETSGYPNFIIENLRPNTTYKFKIRVRRTDSQLTTDSNTVSQTTFKVPTQTLKSKTETSISITWSCDSTVSKVEYSKNGGASYTTVTNSANATSGSYNITGLTANTSYNIITRLTRTLSNTNYPSSVTSITTYQYPYVSAVGTSALVIGKQQTLTLYNPLGRSVNVYMKQGNTSGTQLYSIGSSSTSVTFTPNTNTLLASIPNSTSGNAVYYCVYSSQIVSTKSGTYLIDNTDNSYNPTFNLSDWSYISNLTELTNNNQIVIANQSTITVTVNNDAVAKGGATISGYNIVWGTKKQTISGTTGSVTKGNSDALIVQAIDSRGYTTTTTLQLGVNYLNYFNPTSSSAEALRDDGISEDTTLNLKGSLYYRTFGSNGVQNTIESAKYYTSTDNENWSEGFNIDVSSFTYNNDYYTLNNYNIHNDGTSGGFPVGNRYYVKVDITDKLSTSTFVGIQITDGKLAEDTYQDSNGDYHRGINGLADSNYALKVHGNTKTNDIDATNENLSGDLKFTGGTGSVLPSHFYRNMHDANGNVYDHYYKGTPTTNTTAQLRVWDKTNNTYKTLRFGGDGVMQWNGHTFNDAAYRGVKTLSAKGNSGYGTNNNYVPDMAFIAYWNGAYNSSNSSNLTYAHQGTIQCKPTVLYNNTTGTMGTVTLSQTAANFTYLDFYYKNMDDNRYFFQRIYAPNGKVIGCFENNNNDKDKTWLSSKQYKISGTSVTIDKNQWIVPFSTTSGMGVVQKYNSEGIVRIDGWK